MSNVKRNFIVAGGCSGLLLALGLLLAAIFNKSVLVFLMGALFMLAATVSMLALSYAPPRKKRPKR